MSRTLRVASVGAGYFSQYHNDAWRRIREVEHVAVCDANLARAQTQAQRFGVRGVYDSVEKMLDEQCPDIVDIVTPPQTHRELVMKALERRIFAICQKPLAPAYDEAAAMVEDATRAGSTLVVHENFRWMPWFREARRLIEAGQLGQLHSVAFRLRPGDGQGAQAYLARQPYFQTMPRLLVYETAIHFIDTFRFLMGEITAVYAQLRRINPVIAGEDAGYIVFQFESSATGLFDGNRLNDHVAVNTRRTMGEMWLEGSSGVLRLDGDGRLWWKPHHAEETEHQYDMGSTEDFGGGACENLQRHVVRHLLQGAPLENRAEDYLTNIKVQEAVYRSHAEGRRVAREEFS